MLPSASAIASLVLLLSFVVGGGTVAQPPNPLPHFAVRADMTEEETEPAKREVFEMTRFEWLYNNNDTQLTVCTTQVLLADGEVLVTPPTLIFQTEKKAEQNFVGKVLEDNSNCSYFIDDGLAHLGESQMTYLLTVIVWDDGTETFIYRSGFVTFEIPVKASVVVCNDKNYTRVTGFTPDIQFDPPCSYLNETSESGVCYFEGGLSARSLCYSNSSQPILTICWQDLGAAKTEEVDGLLNINYLAYEGNGLLASSAHMFVQFGDDTNNTPVMEAIIFKEGQNYSVNSCEDNKCGMGKNFKPGFNLYEVCAVSRTDDITFQTSTSRITDLNVNALMYTDSPLIQFSYINANSEGRYNAHLETRVPSRAVDATIDCTAVPNNGTCKGYFEVENCKSSSVTVEYADEKWTGKGNKIMLPCKTETRRSR